jgi:hypothetical protein
MDDFNVTSLSQSKNEWGARLLTILTPFVIEGLMSIFEESRALCKNTNEPGKYLMTFQNFISRIPNWNQNIISAERKRIVDKSGCNYLEDLVTCVHIIQLKLLTAIRVGQKQKKIDINIPKLDEFIHKIYIHIARKIYKNVYLFEMNIPALTVQKNNREIELIVQECILLTIRESIPIESILRAYMDETTEDEIVEEIKEEKIRVSPKPEPTNQEGGAAPSFGQIIENNSEKPMNIKFNNIDYARDEIGLDHQIDAPKNIERLEKISEERNTQRKLDEMGDEEEEDHRKLIISPENVKSPSINNLEIYDLDPPSDIELSPLELSDIVVLD